ncbi:PREDICTED: vacuole membrane protein KMS1-like isoform X2 [Ipomoea nil]|uniref:vacuole membrane protein KMS1-like isoform X2 n=1 Tax=Ipomoea nil TaxID=35883 RepID=UPI000900F07C|nr:PREDICTED: vacuole membrane protein KMS1-like isoform X2 [Ipomoea nil]
MASKENAVSSNNLLIASLESKHQQELQNLTVVTQPLKTVKFFILVVLQYLRQWFTYLLSHARAVWLTLLSGIAVFAVWVTLMQHYLTEVFEYAQYGLWWVALGVASSIGFGSGLHTFVLYLGPHIALFTIKAMKCGRVDLKTAPYDTMQFNRSPSWMGKNCSEFGPPLFSHSVPLTTILQQVQLEAILRGLGTALGEIPSYFVSRAARNSNIQVEDLEMSSTEEDVGFLVTRINKIKQCFLSHAQNMNLLTIIILATVPNPLFDMAGVMCGQFGIPFWKFFIATLVGKGIIKTYMQAAFVILVCNNQLLEWIENELMWVGSSVPGVDSILPKLVAKLHSMKDRYMTTKLHASSNVKVSHWEYYSLASAWNAVVCIMIFNFLAKILNATAQRHLKKQQERELAALKLKLLG